MENYRNVSSINIVESGSMAVLWYKVSHDLGHNRTKKRKLFAIQMNIQAKQSCS